MKTVVAFLALLMAYGCGSGGGLVAPDGGGGDGSADAAAVQTVRVTLSSGSAEGLAVLTGAAEARVQDGVVALAVPEGGGTFAAVLDEQDRPLLVGYVLSGEDSALDARSTALALTFLAAAGYGWTEPQDWPAVLALLAADPDFEPVAAAVTARLSASALALDDAADPLFEAVRAYVRALPDTVPPPLPTATSARAAKLESWVLVQGENPQSGLTVGPDAHGDGVAVTNWFRRHTRAFVYRTGYVGADGQPVSLTPWVPVVEGTYLKAVKGASSTLATAFDTLTGSPIFRPTTVGPFTLPILPADAQQTLYRVVVVGPGAPAEVEGSEDLNAAWLTASRNLALFTLSKEIVMPLLSTFLSWRKDAGIGLDEHQKFGADLLAAATSAGLDVEQGLERNEWPSIILSLVKAVVTNKAFREEVLWDAFEDQLIADKQVPLLKRMNGLNEKLAGALKIVDTGLRAGDLACVARDLSLSKTRVGWDVVAVPVKIRVLPNPAQVVPGGQVTLTADVGPLSEESLELVWRVGGRHGRLAILEAGNEQRGLEVTGSRRDVVYQAELVAPAQSEEPITVEVLRRVGQERQSIGSAEGVIRIVGHTAILEPTSRTIRPGEAAVFTVTVEPVDGGPYELRWQTEATLGAFEGLDTQGRSTGLTATYRARAGAAGVESFTVEVRGAVEGEVELLATLP
ncbi:MAG: hypothetical protein HY901_27150, partial [Deltaproteobacteria bacterium]|nr:hypothetical protein [Deltaproteobacteria bacterium]